MGNRATLIIMGMALSLIHTNPGKGFKEKSPDSCEGGVTSSISLRKHPFLLALCR